MPHVELSPDVLFAIEALKEDPYCPGIKRNGSDLEITATDSSACRCVLSLRDVRILPEEFRPDSWEFFYITAFRRESDSFRLDILCETFEPDDSAEYSIFFADAEIKTEHFGIDFPFYTRDPWAAFALLSILLDQKEIWGAPCNPLETELIPVLREIKGLGKPCPLLRELLLRHGHSREAALLARLQSPEESKHRARRLTRFRRRLSKSRFEPMWRELYDKFTSSQQGIPTVAEVRSDPALLRETRDEIRRYMEARGYSGSYPEFSKTAPLSGFKAFWSHGQRFLPFSAPRIHRFVRCCEASHAHDSLMISFLRGTVFTKKCDAAPDSFSCLFTQGYRRSVSFVRGLTDCTEPLPGAVSLEEAMEIAVKETKLTKEELHTLHGTDPVSPQGLLTVILACGVFSLLFTIAMTLFAWAMPGIFSLVFHPVDMLVLFLVTWAISWAAFGGAFALYTAWLTRRNRSGRI